jgi:hypothetical protein
VPPLGNSSALTKFTGESASKSTELMPFQLSSQSAGANVEEHYLCFLASRSAPNVTDREHYLRLPLPWTRASMTFSEFALVNASAVDLS